ncbi:hypothetical protein CKO33_13245, partial [Ectothiorhodospira mobilis]|nr:hypothetical protein [Ectothiorhodospira mobilis]
LAAWLRREASRPRKQRRTVKQLYGDLTSLGYDGSYNRVSAFARALRIPTQAGRGFRFDVGHHSEMKPARIPI